MAVDKHEAFTPCLEVKECVGGFLHFECAAIDTWDALVIGVGE